MNGGPSPRFVGTLGLLARGLSWRFGSSGTLFIPGGAAALPAFLRFWIPRSRLTEPSRAASAKIYDEQFSAARPAFAEFMRAFRRGLLKRMSEKEAAELQLSLYTGLYYTFRQAVGDSREIAARGGGVAPMYVYTGASEWGAAGWTIFVQPWKRALREWFRPTFQSMIRDIGHREARVESRRPRLLVFCEDRTPRGLNFSAIEPILPALTARFDIDLAVLCTGPQEKYRDAIRKWAPQAGIRWVDAPRLGIFAEVRAAVASLRDASGIRHAWDQSFSEESMLKRRVGEFLRPVRMLEPFYMECVRRWIGTQGPYVGLLAVPDSSHVATRLTQVAQALGIPTFTVDTCLLAEFGGNGVPRHDVTFVSGKWNERIYREHDSRMVPDAGFYSPAVSVLRSIQVVGSTKLVEIPAISPERSNYSGLVVFCTENTGLENARARLRIVTAVPGFSEILIWPHPGEDFESYVEVARMDPRIRVEAREARSYDRLPGAIGIVEFSTMGFELAMRGAYFVSVAQAISSANPYSRISSVPLVEESVVLLAIHEGMRTDASRFRSLYEAQRRDLAEWFNAAEGNRSVGERISDEIGLRAQRGRS